jgi:hypothetical protein
MRVGQDAARSLLVSGMILVAAHVTLLVFDPRALFPSNLLLLIYPFWGLRFACLALTANLQRPGHCGSCSDAVCWSQRSVSSV